MIRVFESNEGPLIILTVTGHAEHGDAPGHDIVCAGVSALYVALAESAARDGALSEHLEGADAKRLKLYPTRAARHYLRMFRVGLEALAREYPECVAERSGGD